MKKGRLALVVLLVAAWFCMTGIGWAAASGVQSPARFGKTYQEIVSLAKKEGRVSYAASFCDVPKFEQTFGRLFKEKFGVTVDYQLIQGMEPRERFLLELKAGHIEYDLFALVPEVLASYYKADVIDGPFDWSGLFGVDPAYPSPDGKIITGGATVFCFAYNPNLVPKDRVPQTWEDLLNPSWKGKFIIVTRPQAFIGLYPHWGKKKTLDYCKALAANNPVWMSSYNAAIDAVARGEYPMVAGANTSDILNLLDRDPTSKIAMRIPKELPVNNYLHTFVVKKNKNPNAALLLAGWLASPEGQKLFDTVAHRGSPLNEGTEINRMVKEAKSKVYYNGFEFTAEMAVQTSKEVMEAWGFPTPLK
jgi:iron(III) transport system substrate-binding protein